MHYKRLKPAMKFYGTTLENSKYYTLVCNIILRNPLDDSKFGNDHTFVVFNDYFPVSVAFSIQY